MKKMIGIFFISALFSLLAACDNSSVSDTKEQESIVFGTSSGYPPFEYKVGNNLQGFDIDLAMAVADQLHKKPVFQDLPFTSLLPALNNNKIDAAISTLTVTVERKQYFAFSTPYYFSTMAVIFNKAKPVSSQSELYSKKVGCDLGTSLEVWAKQHLPAAQVTTFDETEPALAALKAGQIDALLVDGAQAYTFTKNSPELGYKILSSSEEGYAIAFKKHSALIEGVNTALKTLADNGTLKQLEIKWLGGSSR